MAGADTHTHTMESIYLCLQLQRTFNTSWAACTCQIIQGERGKSANAHTIRALISSFAVRAVDQMRILGNYLSLSLWHYARDLKCFMGLRCD